MLPKLNENERINIERVQKVSFPRYGMKKQENMMNYRMATTADLDALVGLLKQLTELEEDFDFDEVSHRRGLEMLVAKQPDCCIMVAEENGTVLGMASGQFVISTACGAPSLWVEDVVIDRSLRGKGIGTELLQTLQSWAQSVGGVRMQLLADKDNAPALKFYEKTGWKRTNFVGMRKMM